MAAEPLFACFGPWPRLERLGYISTIGVDDAYSIAAAGRITVAEYKHRFMFMFTPVQGYCYEEGESGAKRQHAFLDSVGCIEKYKVIGIL